MADEVDPKWTNTKSIGWWIVRDGVDIKLYQLWWPIDKNRKPIEDPVDGSRRSFTRQLAREAMWRCKHIASRFGLPRGGQPTPESRQLALTMLGERFDWSTAVSLLDAFHADFIAGIRLRDGDRRFIAKADVTWWWAIKEDMAASRERPPSLDETVQSGYAL